jgi:hypothetical protein
MGEGKILFAASDEIDKYPHGVDRFLRIVGVKSALVTDQSTVWDFLGVADGDKRLPELGRALGRPVHLNEHLWQIAAELEQATTTGTPQP